ncbi:MAG: cobalamin-binding protein [Armatimonadota bacterium]|nr:cobalamin-binding protein [Armatimonadota bacterium]MDR7436144.1 cobalamin-binding protein [Armatimonadota bacterium]MDR7472023.1 cobalamin-binding protein [Armatimonadota bacterium]MDR7506693.1 cobalamin-binding protein [Armatimonadota bacterium]MDR7508679.1 cobalamin-binding protein [Armatimonadota bacterium]
MRIVSLLPGATEIVCALGLRDRLVGISHDCDYPPEIAGTPVLSQAVVGADLPSGVIDARVREAVHRGTSVYHLDAARLAALRPDLILTQELCAVCAPSYTQVTAAARILDAQPRIVSLEPQDLAGILDAIRLVGDLTGRRARAADLAAGLRARIDRVRQATAGRPRPRVVCLEWLDPLFIAGHWVPEMVEIAGGQDVLGRAGRPSYAASWQEVAAARPDVVVVMPCGFDVARARREISLLTARPGWDDLPAARAGRVYLTDASAYFNRPGPRIATGVEVLASLLHPGAVRIDLPTGAWASLSDTSQ